jgi:hypothetical protein
MGNLVGCNQYYSLKAFFMTIELTKEEQATERRRKRLAIAINHWMGNITDQTLGLAVEKRNISNPKTVAKYKRKAKKKAQNIVKSLDKGFII